MSETPEPSKPAVSEIQARLQDVAGLLRQSDALDPEAQQALADLVAELSRTLAGPAPADEVTHLADTTARLAEALHQRQKRLPITVRDRLERAIINAEAHAPISVGLARRLLDALANIGI